ncbi:uncharacterized protein LOC8059218 [Sorghum bicolor]|uniref:uncharacterized protein LOC8059218 n=1 Tax=Sorghum bicolor TaxID=4558 RepID=UPI000B425033|nr:uncharacterized protein LOC8059218 [Sorghum bicolor]|eukprot:XP_002454856.2 uncharacterized protein LOC8059218 [Sorghum bicolor]
MRIGWCATVVRRSVGSSSTHATSCSRAGCSPTTSPRTAWPEFKISNLLESNSKRKRITVILQDEDGQILLYCKGLDMCHDINCLDRGLTCATILKNAALLEPKETRPLWMIQPTESTSYYTRFDPYRCVAHWR